jgi:hypothetical protein
MFLYYYFVALSFASPVFLFITVIFFSEFWVYVSYRSGWHCACHHSKLKKQSCALLERKKGENKNKLEMHYSERKKE